MVEQAGPRRLWDEAERVHDAWHDLGRPARDRIGLSVTDGEHRIWIDHPDGTGWRP